MVMPMSCTPLLGKYLKLIDVISDGIVVIMNRDGLKSGPLVVRNSRLAVACKTGRLFSPSLANALLIFLLLLTI